MRRIISQDVLVNGLRKKRKVVMRKENNQNDCHGDH